ncbi:ABC transporter permease [Spirochaeta lutea]|uniref:ABC transporter permease n=2 Tax=Spirochaeta lutea TaxID=1480694 RepID=A0A098R229_9SPIO|nr:ABC transporter permease [Spirochaeta lutea]
MQVRPEVAVRVKTARWQKLRQDIAGHRMFYLFLLPGTIYFILFHYVPMWELRLSFFEYGLGGVGEFVGLEHFRVALDSPGFSRAFWNTLILSSMNIVIQMTLTIVISLLLNEIMHQGFKKFVQTAIYLPHFLSWVVVASLFTLLLSQGGLVNAIIKSLGGDPVYFLGDKSWWRPVYLAILAWREVGWGTVIFLASLAGIDPQLYEAAKIDGASRLQQMVYVTLPHLFPTIAIVLIMNLAKIFNLFESVMVLYNSLVYDVSDVLQTYVYRTGIREFRFAYATAIGLFRSVIAFVLVVSANRLTKKLKEV